MASTTYKPLIAAYNLISRTRTILGHTPRDSTHFQPFPQLQRRFRYHKITQAHRDPIMTYPMPDEDFTDDQMFKIRRAEFIIDYVFEDRHLLGEALLPVNNYTGQNLKGGPLDEGNRALALMGDSILYLVHRQDCYEDAKNVNDTHDFVVPRIMNKSLAPLTIQKGLDKCLFDIGTPVISRRNWNWFTDRMATVVEAIVGAAYLDGGLEAAKQVMKGLGMMEPNPPWIHGRWVTK